MRDFQVNIEDYNEKPVAVSMFQLLQWKHALALECKGLTNSRGSVCAMLRKKLNAPRSFTREQMRDYIAGCVESINEQIGV